ncbi:MAG: hypothetical protein V4772_18385 [Pseudomonadota bacterium]
MNPIICSAMLRGAALLLPLLAPLQNALAQSSCSSEGQPRPLQLMERFINADCENCWQDPATAKAKEAYAVLDWVIPGSKGDDAALSAVASRDGLNRLEALKKPAPTNAMTSTLPVKGIKNTTLRVAHGIALSGYIGASIELKPVPAAARGKQLTSWLALVETIPQGTEGSPVERNLVRNVLQSGWDGRKPPAKTEENRFTESRAMSVAQGVNADRLRVIGWVEDAKGQVLVAAQSGCEDGNK